MEAVCNHISFPSHHSDSFAMFGAGQRLQQQQAKGSYKKDQVKNSIQTRLRLGHCTQGCRQTGRNTKGSCSSASQQDCTDVPGNTPCSNKAAWKHVRATAINPEPAAAKPTATVQKIRTAAAVDLKDTDSVRHLQTLVLGQKQKNDLHHSSDNRLQPLQSRKQVGQSQELQHQQLSQSLKVSPHSLTHRQKEVVQKAKAARARSQGCIQVKQGNSQASLVLQQHHLMAFVMKRQHQS